MKDKKLLYVTPAFPIGGLEKLLILLANSLCREYQQEVVSLSSNNVLQSELNESIRFVPQPRKSKFDIPVLWRLHKLIKRNRPESILCLNFFAFFYARLAITLTGSTARILVIYQTTIHGNRKEFLLHKLYVAMLRKKDVVIVSSVNQVKYMQEHYRITPGVIRIIYNGIDMDYWGLPPEGFKKADLRARYKIPVDAKIIILAAAFRPEKNHLGAIRAIRILRENKGGNAYLLLAGEGVMRKEAEVLAGELNLSDFVIFAGPQKDLRPFYWAADIFSLTSTSVETFSIAALEAMSCGLPIVLTNIGGASEMVIDGKNGFLSASDDKSLAENWDKAINTRFSQQEIHSIIAQKFDARLMIREYKNILNECN